MVRRHGPLIQPHYPRRNQYGPIGYCHCEPALEPVRNDRCKSESAVGIGELLQLSQCGTVGLHGDGSDLLIFHRTVVAAGAGGSNCIHHIHAGGHLAECGVLTIQVLGILMHDEELAAAGVGGGGTGHAQNAALMLQIILDAVEEELALDAVAGAAHAGALGAAALDHEAGDDTVEDQAVVEAGIGQSDEVAHALAV